MSNSNKKTIKITVGELKKLIRESVATVKEEKKKMLAEATPPPTPPTLMPQYAKISQQVAALTTQWMEMAKKGDIEGQKKITVELGKLNRLKLDLEAKMADMSGNPFAKFTAPPVAAQPQAQPAPAPAQ